MTHALCHRVRFDAIYLKRRKNTLAVPYVARSIVNHIIPYPLYPGTPCEHRIMRTMAIQ